MTESFSPEVSSEELSEVFRGSIPMAIATVSSSGVTNVTYVSRVHEVEEGRLALSNQFLGKTRRNLVENPRASLLAISPDNYAQYRIDAVFERSERSGKVFDLLRRDIDAIAALGQSTGHFQLRTADIFRITGVTRVFRTDVDGRVDAGVARMDGAYLSVLSDLAGLSGRAESLDHMLSGIRRHLPLLKSDTQIHALRSHELTLTPLSESDPLPPGDELVNTLMFSVTRAESVRIDNLILSARYAQSTSGHRGVEASTSSPGDPGGVKSVVVAPILRRNDVVGVLAWSSNKPGRFGNEELCLVESIAALLSPFVAEAGTSVDPPRSVDAPGDAATLFTVMADDGSVFVNHEYLIRGLAGEILSYLLQVHAESGRVHFSNRELRSVPELDIPGLRENLESRLLELHRRLEEKNSPVQLRKTSRGRFDLDVSRPYSLDRPQTLDRIY